MSDQEEVQAAKQQVKTFARRIIVLLVALGFIILTALTYFSGSASFSSQSAEDAARDANRTATQVQRLLEEQREANDAQACRSLFAANVTDARVDLDDANASLQLSLGLGVEAALLDDPARLDDALGVYRIAKARIDDASKGYRAANAEYQELQRLGRRGSSDTFLTMCQRGPRAGG